MSGERMICKHCGHDEFRANIKADAWLDAFGVFVTDAGKPYFEPDSSSMEWWDYEIEEYVCASCDHTAIRLKDLVTRGEATS